MDLGRNNKGSNWQNFFLFKIEKRRYLPHSSLGKGLKGALVNQVHKSVKRGLLEITSTIPLTIDIEFKHWLTTIENLRT